MASSRLSLLSVLALLGAMTLLGAAPALADTAASSNWSGYAVHRSHVAFRTVNGQWRVPRAACPRGQDRYSAMWVGLGGYSASSQALEQTGTEVDCGSSGRAYYSAWYELVPAPSENIAMAIHPGDLMSASVTAVGRRISVVLHDVTRHRRFSHTFHVSKVDTGSAEWILEAPSACVGNDCEVLPLTDFGKAKFGSDTARTTRGKKGAVSSHFWGTTRIVLTSGSQFVSSGSSLNSDGIAVPSSLAHGTAFSVAYQQPAKQVSRAVAAHVATLSSWHLVHPHAYLPAR